MSLAEAVVRTAESIPYDNTTSGLTADDVQAALDELAASAGSTVDGSGAANQVATWVDSNTLQGDANLTWDGTNFVATGGVFVNTSTSTVIQGRIERTTATVNFESAWEALLITGFGANSIAEQRALGAEVRHNVAFDGGAITAIKAQTTTNAGFSTGTIAELNPVRSIVQHSGAGLVTDMYDYKACAPTIGGSAGLVTRHAQFFAEDPGASAYATDKIAFMSEGTNTHSRLVGGLTVGADAAPTGSNVFDVQGDANVSGKLTVGGLIDPTGLVLSLQGSTPHTPVSGEATLWASNPQFHFDIFGGPSIAIDQSLLTTDTPSFAGLSLTSGPLAIGSGGTGSTTASGARTALGVAIGSDVQAWDADLDAIAALATTGFSARTAANTWALRTLTGTTNQVVVTNGDGVAGNPTFSLPQNIHAGANPVFAGIQLNGFVLVFDADEGSGFDGTLRSNGGVALSAARTWDLQDASGTLALTADLVSLPVAIADGGTGQTTATAAFDALAPTTTLGDVIYHNGSDNVRLAGNITTVRQFLGQTGTGAVSAAPGWITLVEADISDLQNYALVGHTHVLTDVTDVTITVANLNILDDGADTTLHFHAADRARANHTGTQTASTISDFSEAVDDRVAALIQDGTSIAWTYNDIANTLTGNVAQAIGASDSPTFVALTLTQTTGTAPMTISSTTVVTNLNADLLDGNHASAFALSSHSHDASDITTGALAQARGGTGLDTSGVTNGQLLIGNTTGNVFALATLSGTANEIDIANGASSITIGLPSAVTIGTLTLTTDLAVTHGGTGASDAATARTNLGLAIGTDVQAFDDLLQDIADIAGTFTDNAVIVGTGAGTAALESGATLRTSLGLAIGSDVQAFGAVLDDLNTLGAAASDGQFIVATGVGAFAYESGATARTSLGLTIGTDVQAWDAILDDLSGLTQAANQLPYFDTATTAATTSLTVFARTILDDADASAVRTTIGVVIGTDVQAQSAHLDDLAALGAVGVADQLMVSTGAGTWAFEAASTLPATIGGVIQDLDTLGAAASDGQFIVATGVGAFAYESGATVRTSLGLTIGTDVQAFGAVLDDLNALGAAASDGQFIVATGVGAFAYESGATVRTSLGLTIGTDVQAFAAILDDIGAVSAPTGADEVLVSTGAGAFALESGATLRTSLGLAIGSDVQAFDAVLEDLAALAVVADNEFIVGTGAGTYAHESGATARTSMGVGTGDSPQFTGLTLTGNLDAQGNVDLGNAAGDLIGMHGVTGVAQASHIADPGNTAPSPVSPGIDTVDLVSLDAQISTVQTNTSNNKTAIDAILVALENKGILASV